MTGMDNRRKFRSSAAWLLVWMGLGLTPTLWAQDAQPPTDLISSPIDELRIQLRPLTQDELAAAGERVFTAVREQVSAISAAEIELKHVNKRLADVDANDPNVVAQLNEEKAAQVAELTKLRERRTALLDRFDLVLDAYEAKGGDATTYRQYVGAIGGLELPTDVSDAHGAWLAVQGWLTSTEGGIRWGLNIVQFFVTLVVFWFLSLIVGRLVAQAMKAMKNASSLLREFMTNIARRIVMLAGLLVAITFLEIQITPVLAIIGGAAFVIAFALQGTLSNFASGLMILAYRPFDVGDVVKAGGVFGTVQSMNLVSTTINTFDNQRMIVPNNSIWGDVITNVTGLPTRRVDMVFGIGYADDITKAERIMSEILADHPLVLAEPAPVIKLNELGDSSVNFLCRPWVKTPDYWTVYWDVTRKVKERFDAEGVTIPFPQRDVHLFQHNATTG